MDRDVLGDCEQPLNRVIPWTPDGITEVRSGSRRESFFRLQGRKVGGLALCGVRVDPGDSLAVLHDIYLPDF